MRTLLFLCLFPIAAFTTASTACSAESLLLAEPICTALAGAKLPNIPSLQVSKVEIDRLLKKSANYPSGYWEVRFFTSVANESVVFVFDCVQTPGFGVAANMERVE